ncbi:MAG: hypothetical protein J6S69_05420, partial [Proteobacteria bacterium]|nr:hypothetical protein [Pseudomonadota bacterium]
MACLWPQFDAMAQDTAEPAANLMVDNAAAPADATAPTTPGNDENSAAESNTANVPLNDETAVPETAASETAASETAASETAASETAASETAASETAASETAASET